MRLRPGVPTAWWIGVVLALVAAACSSSDDGVVAPVPTPSTESSDSTASTVPPTTEPSAEGVPPTSPAAPSPGAPPTSVAGRGSPAPTAPPAGSRVPVVAVGQLAPILLRPGFADRIVVEVRAQEGAAPRAATLDHLRRVLRDVSGKEVVLDGVTRLAGGGQAWTGRSIAEAADAASSAPADQVTLRLLFLRGSFEGNRGVLGVAVRGDVAAVFSDQVSAAAGLLVSPAVVEDAVTIHEVGHLLGLVDLVLRTGRADPAHPGHSPNRRSVMYWQVESGAITQLLDGGIPNELDAADRADLAAIRNG